MWEHQVDAQALSVVELAPIIRSSNPQPQATGYGTLRATWMSGTNVETSEAGAGGVFSEPISVLAPYPYLWANTSRSFVSDARGDQAVTWTERTEHSLDSYVSSRRADGTFGPPQLLAGAESAALTMDPAGRITVIWRSSAPLILMAASGTAGEPLGEPSTVWIAPPGEQSSWIKSVLTSTGIVIATWQIHTEGETRSAVESATSVDGVHFGPVHRLSTPSTHFNKCIQTVLAPDRVGGALVGLTCSDSQGHSVNEYARFR